MMSLEAQHLSASGPLAQFVWNTRYRNADPLAGPCDATVADTWRRVARAAAAIERDPADWATRFYDLLRGFRFLPGGRILAGAGTTRVATLFNCFVMGIIDDSAVGVFEALKEGAVTMQQGGGIGNDFSTIRPRGCRARSSGIVATGPVACMTLWDTMCATLPSSGPRRGAMMATLRCDHPDVEQFVAAKCEPGKLTNFNLSLQASDGFLGAVEKRESWPLLFPEQELAVTDPSPAKLVLRRWTGAPGPVPCRVLATIGARELWDCICASAHASAEPGMLFIDRINAENNLAYCEHLTATNPCAEEPLPPFGACNLGSINLTAFVADPFTAGARLDFGAVASVARAAVRFLDNIIDISRFPLLRQREQAHSTRRIGLGFTGLADALAMLSLPYDTDAARHLAAAATETLRNAAYEASSQLAAERGAFPLFDADQYLQRPVIRRLPAGLRDAIARTGLRNSHLLAIAPAGTISLLAGNVSSGIEPIVGLEATRYIAGPEGRAQRFRVGDFAYELWRSLNPSLRSVPAAFRIAEDIAPRDHLLMQAAVQPAIDGAISKTILLAERTTAADISRVYSMAHDLGLKGCTVFRRGSRRGVTEAEPPDYSARGAHCCDAGEPA
jgi:ribonucleoside-diphosphate reductase alpha chain